MLQLRNSGHVNFVRINHIIQEYRYYFSFITSLRGLLRYRIDNWKSIGQKDLSIVNFLDVRP